MIQFMFRKDKFSYPLYDRTDSFNKCTRVIASTGYDLNNHYNGVVTSEWCINVKCNAAKHYISRVTERDSLWLHLGQLVMQRDSRFHNGTASYATGQPVV